MWEDYHVSTDSDPEFCNTLLSQSLSEDPPTTPERSTNTYGYNVRTTPDSNIEPDSSPDPNHSASIALSNDEETEQDAPPNYLLHQDINSSDGTEDNNVSS